MKFMDYLRLSIINNKNKSSVIIRCLLIFSTFFISLALFLIITMDFSIKNELEDHKEISAINIDLSDGKYDSDYASYISSDYKNNLVNIKGVKDYITNDCYSITTNDSKSKMIIDGNEYTLNKNLKSFSPEEDEYSPGYIPFNIIDMNMTSSIFIDADYDYSDKPLIAGNEFSNNSAGEIIISSFLLDAYGINYNDCIGKNISIQVYINRSSEQVSSSKELLNNMFFNEYVNDYITIINNFTIVGVYDGNIYKSEARYSESGNLSTRNSYFWITNDSYSTSAGASPELIIDEDFYYYSKGIDEMEEYCLENKCILLLLGSVVRHSYQTSELDRSHMIIQFKSFGDLWKSSYIIDDLYRKSTTYTGDIDVTNECYNELYGDYTFFYPIYYYSILIIGVSAVAIFIVSILLLINMFNHSINMKKGYVAMLGAMGYKRKNLNLMLLSDIGYLTIFSTLITFIVGTISSIAISVILNNILFDLKENDLLNINISFGYGEYLLSFVIVSIMLFIITLIIS